VKRLFVCPADYSAESSELLFTEFLR